MNDCKCDAYFDLELDRKSISKRIVDTKEIVKSLKELKSVGEHSIHECTTCKQMWQISRAWNWGNKKYAFKVPRTDIVAWEAEQYMCPDEMLVYSAIMKKYYEDNSFHETVEVCRREGCDLKAIESSVLCKKHHIESMINIGSLPKSPEGKIFASYYY